MSTGEAGSRSAWTMPAIIGVLFLGLGVWSIATGAVWPGVAFVCLAAGRGVLAAFRARSRR